jgi:predicted transcriptional regulator
VVEIVSIKNYMSKQFATIDSESSAVDVCKSMTENSTKYLIVTLKGKPAGIVTEWDVTSKVVGLEKDPSKAKASEFMSSPLITVDPDSHIDDTVALMVKRNVSVIPVVKSGILYGVFGARELIQHFDELEDKLSRDLIRACTMGY